jgi:hypothetical protein
MEEKRNARKIGECASAKRVAGGKEKGREPGRLAPGKQFRRF